MFRNKILVRASSPSSSSPFFLIPLSLPPADDPSSSSLFHPIDLQILCCKLSRTYALACFLHSDDIFIIYQRSQSDSAARVVEEIVKSLPSSSVGVEEEVKSASLIAKAVDCGLRSVMLDNSWCYVGEKSFVQSTFACSEERKHLCAINVRVQAETDNRFVFLVSPDVLWFKRHKISDLASSQMLEKFENGQVVIVEEYGLSTSCKILPSLNEGYVRGLSKLLPAGETFNRFEELLLMKHGLALPSNYFLNLQFSNGDSTIRQWYPSAFVLQGSGLAPAPQTIRTSKAMQALEFFVNLVGGWDFFSQGLLEVKEVSSLGTSTLLPVWKTATSNLKDVTLGDGIPYTDEATREQNTSLNHLQLALDFRTPKTVFGCTVGEKHTDVHQNAMLMTKSSLDRRVKCTRDADIIKHASVAQTIRSESECVNGSNSSEKKQTSAAEGLSEIPTAELEHARESRVPEKKDVSAEDAMIKITTEESVSINMSSLHERSVAEKKLTSSEGTSVVTTAESDLVSENSVTEMKHATSGDCMSEQDVSVQKVEDNVQSGSRVSQNKEEIEAFLDKQCLDSTKMPHPENLVKRTLSNEKSKEAPAGTGKKMKMKQSADTSDIIAKVMDYHSRGALQSLTVPDLKSFLTAKKAKVGGKKEELILRITALLS